MLDLQTRQKFLLGSAVKITSILNIATATSITISICDPSLTEKVSSANMTKEADKVYTYVYQSNETDISGYYTATIVIVYAGYTTIKQEHFYLFMQEC